jgi:hypothetical protein
LIEIASLDYADHTVFVNGFKDLAAIVTRNDDEVIVFARNDNGTFAVQGSFPVDPASGIGGPVLTFDKHVHVERLGLVVLFHYADNDVTFTATCKLCFAKLLALELAG